MNQWTDLIPALAGLVTAIGAALALVLRAIAKSREAESRPRSLLQRLWDWVEGNDHQVPPTLSEDIRSYLRGDQRRSEDDKAE